MRTNWAAASWLAAIAKSACCFSWEKDVFRWLEQCMDWASHAPALREREWRLQSFAALLAASTPAEVKEKLTRWGVSDYISIFRRAIGLNTMFANPPAFGELADEFLRNYHKYADSLYQCFMEMEAYPALDPRQFHFALYASGEYSRMLESQWGEKTE